MMQDLAQDILRLNNRLSDMQAIMEQTQAFENRVLADTSMRRTSSESLTSQVCR